MLCFRKICHGILFVLLFWNVSFAQENENLKKTVADFIEQKQFKEAQEYLKKYLKANKKSISANRLLASVYLAEDEEKKWKDAEKYLKKALKIDKKNTPVLVELAGLYTNRYKLKQAEKYLKEILKYDEYNVFAYKGLLRVYILQKDKYKIEPLVGELLNTKDLPAGFNLVLGEAFIQIEDYEEAEDCLKKVKKEDGNFGEACFLLGKLSYNKRDNKMATEYLYSGIRGLRKKIILEKFYLTMSDILSEKQKQEYEDTPPENRGAYLAAFWRRRDVDLFTPENERMIEHMRRVETAREKYSMPDRRGYDDRGRYLIKWGEPDIIYTDYFASSISESFASVRESESWIYSSIDRYLYLDFVKIGKGFRFVTDLGKASATSGTRDQVRRSAIIKRANERIEIYLRMARGEMMEGERNHALDEAPPDRFYPDDKTRFTDMPVDVAQFRGSNGKTIVSLVYGFSAAQFPGDEGETFTLQKMFLSRDIEGKVIFEDRKNEDEEIFSVPGLEDPYFLDINELILKPDFVEIAFMIKDEAEKITGIYSDFVQVKNFSTEKFICSDIIFAGDITSAGQREGSFRENLKIHPYPFKRVLKDKPVYIYFEAYNLGLDENGNSSYQLEYTLTRTKGSGNFIRRIIDQIKDRNREAVATQFTRKGTQTDEQEYFSILFSALEAGEYLLKIEVTDLIKNQTEIIKKEFTLFENLRGE